MDIRTETVERSESDATIEEGSQTSERRDSLIVRTLRNPLFLVIFTWVLMAFLLAFEVSGK